jgi:hypothetical protein
MLASITYLLGVCDDNLSFSTDEQLYNDNIPELAFREIQTKGGEKSCYTPLRRKARV